MVKHKIFLKWWFIFTLTSIGSVFAFRFGSFHEIYEKDSSMLSFVIIAIFAVMSLICGSSTWSLSKAIANDKPTCPLKLKKMEHYEEMGWFMSELCLTLGMIGTVVGFIMMLAGFAAIDITNIKTVQTFLNGMGLGMSTALYTTLVGLICGALLKLQYLNFSLALDRFKATQKCYKITCHQKGQ